MKRTVWKSVRTRARLGFLGAFALASLIGGAQAEDAKSPSLLFRGTRPAGMGNAFEAVANDYNAFEFNPAGLANYSRFKVDIVPAQAQLTSDFVDAASEFSDLMTDVDDLRRDVEADPNAIFSSDSADALVERISRIRKDNYRLKANVPVIAVATPIGNVGGVRLVGGASFTDQVLVGVRFEQAGLSWGSEVINVLDDDIAIQMALDVATLRFGVAAETGLDMPIADIPFLDKARAGLSWRVVSRRYKDDRFTLIDILDVEQFKKDHFDTSVLEDGEVNSYSDVSDLLDANTTKETGFGVDVGFQVDHTDYLTTALVFRNLASSIGERKFPATRTVSAAIRPMRLLNASNPLLDVVAAVSLSNGAGDDFLVQFRNRSLSDKLHLGLEATLFPSSPVRLVGRLGNNHGYTTAGFDLHLAVLDISTAYYGDLDADWYTANVRLTF